MPEYKSDDDYDIRQEELRQDIHYIREYWTPRNQLVEEFRRYMSGRNLVKAPVGVKYTIKTQHTYVLPALVNEKVSRFMSIPEIQAIPFDSIDPEGRELSTEIERWINVQQYEMERVSGGNVWDKVTLDAILLDCGVERIDRNPMHFWPEMVAHEGTEYQYNGEARDNYKKDKGSCLRTTYVPLEYTFPLYDGSFLSENFEYEQRSLDAVLKAFPDTSRQLSHLKDDNKTKDIILVHHTTPYHHAIYAIDPSSGGYTNQMRNDRENVWLGNTGELVYLYHYAHNLCRDPHNYVSGRFGGWQTSEGGILDIGKGILHLNETLDELNTQIYTNIRATKWPSFVFKVDPEKRGFNEKGPPKAPVVPEGGDITMYVGEELTPLMQAQEDPVLSWYYGILQSQITRLGGNPALFGENQPGVRTGYQQALQIAEAEGVDKKLEEHLAQGVINRATIICQHIKALDEKVWVFYTEKKQGKKTGRYLSLDPKDLTPMPRFDARVRKPRPVDFIAALRAAKEASDERQGKGPLLSDDTILSDILARDEPDVERKKKLVEAMQNKILASGVLDQRIGDALNIRLAQDAAPTVNPGMAGQVNSAMLQAIQGMTPNSVGQGGVNPQTLSATMAPGLPPGPVTNDSQPENRIGEDVSRAEML